MSESRTAGQGEDVFEASDVEPLLSGYRSLPGIFDEMVDRDGRVRAHWQPLLAMLARMGHHELTRRFAAADRHLHDSGVFYRVYEDASGVERPWPLSHVPLLINGGEWQALKAGLIQRAELLEAVLADAYGPAIQAFQAELSALNRHDEARVCVLTPGSMNETYFEHAYLARYLGFLLVAGEDLTVREDGVFIRTVSGLRRAEVFLRRLDADFADPLELNVRSRLGVPGLVQAVRDGTVVIAKALGSGLVEARALLSFLPALAPALLGRALALPNVATWWLGQAQARHEIIHRLDEMVIASAFSDELPGYGEQREVLGARLEPDKRTCILG